MLDKIIENKRKRLAVEMAHISVEGLKRKLQDYEMHNPVNFYNAIKKNDGMAIIAEVKKASPSKGILREDFNPDDIAREYASCGVEALSVLTEEDYFLGRNEYLVKIRQKHALPILRKDFILDMRQVYESRLLGADAILLIASLLSDDELKRFQAAAHILNMQCLVEVHNGREMERTLNSGAKIIGINNRDLSTFKTDIKTTAELIGYVPGDRAVVSESGISSYQDIVFLRSLGVDAVLVGEAFMKSESITEKVRELKYGRS